MAFVRCRRDPCGVICLILTYFSVFYADYVVIQYVLIPAYSDRINNCVGELNQKYFIQFLFYTGMASLYSLVLVVSAWVEDPQREGRSRERRRGDAQQTPHSCSLHHPAG
ncbi:Palmitoyltransferase ZDHHC3 [Dissostichus eleginoides]|uniref:Palmitoyltransferase n=1 Tax=Dissostichus eleginoides TaxID=100907 RepID=A0AAD9BWF9_DISEL|nr:Palmitoyltransferase ZDHHC3 [Dissostichus eleginoides]